MDECGPLSARYKCQECGETAMLENRRELVAHEGPAFDHWLTRTLASFGIVDLDAGRGKA